MRKIFLWSLICLGVASVAASAQADLFWRLKADFTGTVTDTATRQPLEGVYVLAEYTEGSGNWFAHSASWCVRTAGVHTDKAGKFTFSPGPHGMPILHLIKVGYQLDTGTTISERRRRGEPITPTIYYMAKQDLRAFQKTEYVKCTRAKSAVDVAANLVYLDYLAEEYQRYQPNSAAQEIIQKAIHALKNLPQNPTDSTIAQ